jgi:TonB family protein
MRRWTAIAVLAFCSVISPFFTVSRAQDEQADSKRKVVNRVLPIYPAMARTINLRGSVKIEAVVATNGTVKLVEIKGGHPLLAQAAESAIRKWKWEPATHETREPIEVKFDPQ